MRLCPLFSREKYYFEYYYKYYFPEKKLPSKVDWSEVNFTELCMPLASANTTKYALIVLPRVNNPAADPVSSGHRGRRPLSHSH